MAFRLRQLVRDYAALAVSETVSKLAGFVAFAYLARTLGPGDYGAVEFTVAMHMVGFLIVDFGLAPIGARAITNEPDPRDSHSGRQIPGTQAPALGRRLHVHAARAPMADRARTDALPLVAIYGLSLLASPWKLNWLLQGLDLIRFVGPAQLIYMVAFALGVLLCVRARLPTYCGSDSSRSAPRSSWPATSSALGGRHVRDLRPQFDLSGRCDGCSLKRRQSASAS